jgi:hypothetical protein
MRGLTEAWLNPYAPSSFGLVMGIGPHEPFRIIAFSALSKGALNSGLPLRMIKP